jgi:hypothetical protein
VPIQTILFGDADGFGLGLDVGDLRPGPFFDQRDESDPPFTDHTIVERELSISLSIDDPPMEAEQATLRLLTLGIQDGDDQVLGRDSDLRLFVNGLEVPAAFDAVDQFSWDPLLGWVELVGLVEVEIPWGHFDFEGRADLELTLLNEELLSGTGGDAFAIDYLELVFER